MFQEIPVFYIICNPFVGVCFDFRILPLGALLGMFVLFPGQRIICTSPVYSTTFIGGFRLSRERDVLKAVGYAAQRLTGRRV